MSQIAMRLPKNGKNVEDCVFLCVLYEHSYLKIVLKMLPIAMRQLKIGLKLLKIEAVVEL